MGPTTNARKRTRDQAREPERDDDPDLTPGERAFLDFLLECAIDRLRPDRGR